MNQPRFEATTGIPHLGDDEIHVWCVESPGVMPSRALSGLVHQVLGRLLVVYGNSSEPPAVLRGEHGKPFAPGLNGIEFNVTHSGRFGLLAIARGVAVGIDIESTHRQRPVDDIAERYYAPAEAAALKGLPEGQRLLSFLRLWTGKEAVLKALGHGLSFGLDRVEFLLDDDGAPCQLRHVDHADASQAGWCWQPIDIEDDYVAAIAWQGAPRRVRLLAATNGDS